MDFLLATIQFHFRETFSQIRMYELSGGTARKRRKDEDSVVYLSMENNNISRIKIAQRKFNPEKRRRKQFPCTTLRTVR